MRSPPVTTRPATQADIPHILRLIRALAEYEKLSHAVVATEEDLRLHLFGERPVAEALIGSVEDEPAGYALFFQTFSTFLARPGLWLEDLFVLPAHRSRGVGRALLSAVEKLASERKCGRLEWSVLDWNESAIEFYKRAGATVLPDWRICRVTGDKLFALAEPR